LSSDRCDVLIVGGGPGGSSCAWKLRRQGLDVLVLDRKTFPRDKTCAGWVTPPVLNALAFDRAEYARERVFQPITGFRTGVIGKPPVETHYDEPVSFGIRRCEFDHYLLARSGARLRLGESFRSMERSPAGTTWIVNGEIETPLVVGAGGHFCPVARRLSGGKEEATSVVAAQEIEFEPSADDLARCGVEPAIPELYFCDDLRGYAWCFRKGNFLNIGLGRLDPDRLSSHVAAFVDFLREHGRVRCNVPEKFHGHAYRLYEGRGPRLFDDGVLLVGDAAGLAYPQSGEGIRPAVESGLAAAEVIANAAGNYTRDRLAGYRDAIVSLLGTPRGRAASDWLPASWLHFVASRLLSNRWFSRHVVLDRWFLHSV